jgi:hypothetical protein
MSRIMQTRAFRWSGVVLLALACSAARLFLASSARPTPPDAVFATVTLSGGGTSSPLNVWKNNATGRITFQYPESTDTWVLENNSKTIREVVDGAVSVTDTYETSSGAWDSIETTFGVGQSEVNDALTNGQPASEPTESAILVVDPPNANTRPYVTNSHYSSHLTNLQSAVGFAIPTATSVDGYTLMDSALTREKAASSSDSSGPIASLWYYTPGSVDSAISVSVGKPNDTDTNWGANYRALYNSSGPTLVGQTYSAAKIDENQVIYVPSGVYQTFTAVTTSWVPSDAEWDTILSALTG